MLSKKNETINEDVSSEMLDLGRNIYIVFLPVSVIQAERERKAEMYLINGMIYYTSKGMALFLRSVAGYGRMMKKVSEGL